MPWRECSVMDERMKFVARRLAGEGMAELCREFGISRKTGYKIFDRYQACGIEGLTDRSWRPYRYANQPLPAGMCRCQVQGLPGLIVTSGGSRRCNQCGVALDQPVVIRDPQEHDRRMLVTGARTVPRPIHAGPFLFLRPGGRH